MTDVTVTMSRTHNSLRQRLLIAASTADELSRVSRKATLDDAVQNWQRDGFLFVVGTKPDLSTFDQPNGLSVTERLFGPAKSITQKVVSIVKGNQDPEHGAAVAATELQLVWRGDIHQWVEEPVSVRPEADVDTEYSGDNETPRKRKKLVKKKWQKPLNQLEKQKAERAIPLPERLATHRREIRDFQANVERVKSRLSASVKSIQRKEIDFSGVPSTTETAADVTQNGQLDESIDLINYVHEGNCIHSDGWRPWEP